MANPLIDLQQRCDDIVAEIERGNRVLDFVAIAERLNVSFSEAGRLITKSLAKIALRDGGVRITIGDAA